MLKHPILNALAFVFALASMPAIAGSGVQLGIESATEIIARGFPVYPEGDAYDSAGKRFFTGSARLGHLFVVDETGELKQFSFDDRIASTLGIKVDAPRNRIVAAVTDYGVGVRGTPEHRTNLAAVGVFDLSSGKLLQLHDLTDLVPGPAHLANDVAVDAQGNIYVTDSLAHAIYKVDPTGTRSVLVQSEQFRGEGFALNGLDVHPDGYLLVAKKSDGKLFKVPLDRPESVAEVRLPEPITAADGILLAGGDLVVIRNRTAIIAANEIVVLRSGDGWASATVAERLAQEDVYPTTATLKGNKVVTVASQLNRLGAVLKNNLELQQQFKIYAIGTVTNTVEPR